MAIIPPSRFGAGAADAYRNPGTYIVTDDLPEQDEDAPFPPENNTIEPTAVYNVGYELVPPTQLPAIPEPPVVTVDAGLVSIALDWDAVEGAVSYNIYRGTVSNEETLIKSGVLTAGYTDAGQDVAVVLDPSTPYFYKVTAVNEGGESALSAEVTGTMGARNLPGLIRYHAFETLILDSAGGPSLTNDGVSQVAGKLGNAARAAVAGNGMSLGASLGLTTRFSLAFWVKLTARTGRNIIADVDGSFTKGWIAFDGNDGSFQFQFMQGTGPGIATLDLSTMVVGQWAHFVVDYDGAGLTNADRLKLYVNGAQVDPDDLNYFNGDIPSVIDYTGCTFGIPDAVNFSMNGAIDEAAIGNTAGGWGAYAADLYRGDAALPY